jgi:hypothetical protein
VSEHPATKRANNYACAGGQPYFTRTLLKQTRKWLKQREREREEQAQQDDDREES